MSDIQSTTNATQQQSQQPGFFMPPHDTNNSLFAGGASNEGYASNQDSIYSSQIAGVTDQSLEATDVDSMTSQFMVNSGVSEQEKQEIIKHIDELKYAERRDNALLELSRQREHFQELAPFIWHSVGTIAALLQEIVSVYPLLSPPLLDSKTSNKACNVLALLQCVASHKDTRPLFLKAHITLFLYPFLNTVSKGRSFEYLRLTSLGVVGALVKVDDSEVISFLLQTEIIPLCLRIMERGTDLSQTVATFIIQKILMDSNGLTYLCMTAERFFAVSTVLNNMVESQLQKPSTRLLKHIIKCYFRLSENPRAQMALNTTMPTIVKEMLNENQKLTEHLDDSSKKLLSSLIETLQLSNMRNTGAGGEESNAGSQDTLEHQHNGVDFANADFMNGGAMPLDQFESQQLSQHQKQNSSATSFSRQSSHQPGTNQPSSQQQIQQQMQQRPLSTGGNGAFMHPAGSNGAQAPNINGKGQVNMQGLLIQGGADYNQQRQMSSQAMPFAAAQALRQNQQVSMSGNGQQQLGKQQPFGGNQNNSSSPPTNQGYMFQGRGGVVTSPRLNASQQSQQQLNYMPQPGAPGVQSRTSPPPAQQQPAFMHQFQNQPSIQPGGGQFSMMQPHFGYSLQQRQQSQQQQQQQTQQYAQRQQSPNMPQNGTNGPTQNNFFY